MTHAQKCKIVAYVVLLIISLLEIGLFCKIFNAFMGSPKTIFFIVSFVILFNGSIWWFRKIYDKAKDSATKDMKHD